VANYTTLGALDLTGQVSHGIDAAIEATANAVTTTVPKVARLTTSLFPLPDTVDNAIVGSIDFITQGGMWLAKISASATVQALLFGAPGWIQAARTATAVYGTTAGLQHGDTSAQFLARCLGESCLPSQHRDTFKAYLDLKKKLAAVAPDHIAALPEANKLQQQLSSHAVRLGESVDLTAVNTALSGASAFAKQSPEKIKELSERIAASIVDDVQRFYIQQLGSSAGRVTGTWDNVKDQSTRESRRQETQATVAKRLTGIFSEDLSSHETAVRINKIAASLNSSFGTYRYGFMGLLGTTLGVAWHSGVLLSHAAVAWGYITGGVGYTIRVSTGAIRKGVCNALTWGKDKVKDSVDELTSDLKKTIKEQVKSSLAESIPATANAGQTKEASADSKSSSGESVATKPHPKQPNPFTNEIVVSAYTPSPPGVPTTSSQACRIVVQA
jgi:hypothetical protein